MRLFGNITNSSGTFTHIGGIAMSFRPYPNNVISKGIDIPTLNGDTKHYDMAIKTLIVPSEIKGFANGFLKDWAVTELLTFSNSIISIGTEDGDRGAFTNCYLPEVVLPGSVTCIGRYAFGKAYIKKLVIHPDNKSKYNRQFKDAIIEELYLPKIGLEAYNNSQGSDEYGFYRNFFIHCRCNVIEY